MKQNLWIAAVTFLVVGGLAPSSRADFVPAAVLGAGGVALTFIGRDSLYAEFDLTSPARVSNEGLWTVNSREIRNAIGDARIRDVWAILKIDAKANPTAALELLNSQIAKEKDKVELARLNGIKTDLEAGRISEFTTRKTAYLSFNSVSAQDAAAYDATHAAIIGGKVRFIYSPTLIKLGAAVTAVGVIWGIVSLYDSATAGVKTEQGHLRVQMPADAPAH